MGARRYPDRRLHTGLQARPERRGNGPGVPTPVHSDAEEKRPHCHYLLTKPREAVVYGAWRGTYSSLYEALQGMYVDHHAFSWSTIPYRRSLRLFGPGQFRWFTQSSRRASATTSFGSAGRRSAHTTPGSPERSTARTRHSLAGCRVFRHGFGR